MVRTTAGSDSEEWCCPRCGRRIVLRQPPSYQRLVIDPGDDSVEHAGGTGGVMITEAAVGDVDDAVWLAENGIMWHPPQP
jgi:hypothetical protein